jgi:hypothetical protein
MLTVEEVEGTQLGDYNCSIHNRFGGAFAILTLTQPQGKFLFLFSIRVSLK